MPISSFLGRKALINSWHLLAPRPTKLPLTVSLNLKSEPPVKFWALVGTLPLTLAFTMMIAHLESLVAVGLLIFRLKFFSWVKLNWAPWRALPLILAVLPSKKENSKLMFPVASLLFFPPSGVNGKVRVVLQVLQLS